MIIRPYGYAIWESMVNVLDKKFKEFINAIDKDGCTALMRACNRGCEEIVKLFFKIVTFFISAILFAT